MPLLGVTTLELLGLQVESCIQRIETFRITHVIMEVTQLYINDNKLHHKIF